MIPRLRIRLVLALPAWGVLLASVALARDFQFFEPLRPPRPVKVVAHGGESAQAPGSTRPALVRCIEDGVEWASVAVVLTRDGQHATASGDWRDGAQAGPEVPVVPTLQELVQRDVGAPFAARFAGERILRLRECLDLSKGKLNLRLDCATADPERLGRELLAAGMERQVLVSGSEEFLRRMHALFPGQLALLGEWRSSLGTPQWAASNQLDAVEIETAEITEEVCASFHAMGIKVLAASLGAADRPEVWNRAIEAGPDWIETRAPEELIPSALWRRLKSRPVRFSLHRGASRYAPENTLPA